MYDKFILPIIDKLDAETEHLAIRELLFLLEQSPEYEKIIRKIAYRNKRVTDKKLHINMGGLRLDNPLIVGAGWDKVGHGLKACYDLGFAAVEVGTITKYFQYGNSQPRDFILKKGVRLNRYGFTNSGMEEFSKVIESYQKIAAPIGINIGKNKDVPDEKAADAHADVLEHLYNLGDYFTINVSSPNTVGLRKLQEKEPLTKIVKSVTKVMSNKGKAKPLFVKIAPDLTFEAVNDVIEVVLENKLTGIVATNTTLNSDIKAKYGERWRDEMGGVSGDDNDYRKMSTEIIKHIYKKAGRELIIIGSGGIKDTSTALEKIKAGATALQIYTAFDEEGPTLPGKINEGLLKYMEKEGLNNISELVGINAK